MCNVRLRHFSGPTKGWNLDSAFSANIQSSSMSLLFAYSGAKNKGHRGSAKINRQQSALYRLKPQWTIHLLPAVRAPECWCSCPALPLSNQTIVSLFCMKHSAEDASSCAADDSSKPRYPLRPNLGQAFNLTETQLPLLERECWSHSSWAWAISLSVDLSPSTAQQWHCHFEPRASEAEAALGHLEWKPWRAIMGHTQSAT